MSIREYYVYKWINMKIRYRAFSTIKSNKIKLKDTQIFFFVIISFEICHLLSGLCLVLGFRFNGTELLMFRCGAFPMFRHHSLQNVT